MVRNIFS
ncbi:hypothetical protein CP061683_1008A, partial [Chlamydia psittaci 06-1683]